MYNNNNWIMVSPKPINFWKALLFFLSPHTWKSMEIPESFGYFVLRRIQPQHLGVLFCIVLPFHFLSVLVLHSLISISSRIHNTYWFSILFSHFVFSFLQKMHWKRVCYENNGSHDAHTVSITMLLPVYGSFNKLTSLACYLFI